jgi:hypothetical protein
MKKFHGLKLDVLQRLTGIFATLSQRSKKFYMFTMIVKKSLGIYPDLQQQLSWYLLVPEYR